MTDQPSRRIVIIGGVAAGMKSAAKARRQDPDASIQVFTDEEYISYAGCGEPYYIADEFSEREKLLSRTPDQVKQVHNIDVQTKHRVTKIDPQAKEIEVENLETNEYMRVPYDALVIGTGARTVMPPIPGRELKGVHVLRTMPDTFGIRDHVDTGQVNKAVVVGGGYIGLEMVESLVARGVEVTVVEMMPQLAPPYDADVAAHIKNELENQGVDVRLETKLEEIIGTPEQGVTAVRASGQEIPAQLVLMAVGVRPNVELAKEAGIALGETGAIKVDERMQTNMPGIYAGGDCVECIHRVSGKPVWVPLGSTANKQGRVIGINVTGGNATFPGILSTAIFRVFSKNVARTGLIERECRELGYDYETAIVPVNDKPGYMPGSAQVIIKLIAEKGSRKVLGAQVWGPGNCDKPVDIIATSLCFNGKVDDLMQLDLAYAPPYSPALSNVITAANVLFNKLTGDTEGVTPSQVQEKEREGDGFVFLDVRPPSDMHTVCVQPTLNIPLGQLRERCDEIPEDKEVITSCKVGLSATHAYRILKHQGRQNVKYMDGGICAWPDPKKGEC